VRREVESKREGLLKCFIYRDKKTQNFYLYAGTDFNDPRHSFLMMAKYVKDSNHFRIYTTNAYKYP
jgi:hypothetical protein